MFHREVGGQRSEVGRNKAARPNQRFDLFVGKLRTRAGVVEMESRRVIGYWRLVVEDLRLNKRCCSDRPARVAGGGGEIHFPERRSQIDLAVRDGVHGAATGERKIKRGPAAMKRVEQRKEGFFV